MAVLNWQKCTIPHRYWIRKPLDRFFLAISMGLGDCYVPYWMQVSTNNLACSLFIWYPVVSSHGRFVTAIFVWRTDQRLMGDVVIRYDRTIVLSECSCVERYVSLVKRVAVGTNNEMVSVFLCPSQFMESLVSNEESQHGGSGWETINICELIELYSWH